jgi:hypothetical protein
MRPHDSESKLADMDEKKEKKEKRKKIKDRVL